MREVGALLMAFAPLDAVLISEQVEAVIALGAAFGLGLLFWTGSVIIEWFVGVYGMGDGDEN
ncbi:MAG: hypothetical protein EXR93_08900 [Gemmatimonadetes bacterium]|nr:hypothetical protein [Gemmatimonadota bacterium]